MAGAGQCRPTLPLLLLDAAVPPLSPAPPHHPAAAQAAFAKVRADKLREVTDGHDGTWVAHPGLIPLAKQVLSAYRRRRRLTCLDDALELAALTAQGWRAQGAPPPPCCRPWGTTSDLALCPSSRVPASPTP